MSFLLKKTAKIIGEYGLLSSGDFVIVGVSGGPDSMALLSVLVRLARSSNFCVLAAHLHHGLRAEADQDQRLVEAWCQKNKIDFYVRQHDLRQEAKKRGMGIEETGRLLRQDFFTSLAKQMIDKHKLSPEQVKIALAHHKQDQAETILLNLGRGTGLAGLAGMKHLDFPYIRPFLSFDKKELMQELEQEDIPWAHDLTNQENDYMRNRIRNILLPCWEEILGYDPVTQIVRAGESLAADEFFLQTYAQDVFSRIIKNNSLDCRSLLEEDQAIIMRVLLIFFKHIAGTVKDISKKHLALILSAVKKGGPYDLPYGYKVEQVAGYLYLLPQKGKTEAPLLRRDWEIRLSDYGLTALPESFGTIEILKIEYNPKVRYNSLMNCFKPEILNFCTVRLCRPGDLILPAGREGTKTIKKFMYEQGIPPQDRTKIPLIVDGKNTVWLAEHACGNDYVMQGDQPAQGLRLIWHKPKQPTSIKSGGNN